MSTLHSIFDTHAHYADKAFDDDRKQLLEEILPAAGIAQIMLAGITLADCRQSAALAQQYSYIWCSAGIHPCHVEELPDDWLAQLRELARFSRCRAIGEIGLDYYHHKSSSARQKEILLQQIALAQELDMPMIFHFRDATGDAVEILKACQPRGVLHCFNSSAEVAEELLHIPDLYFSFSGVLTYKNARKPVEAIQVIPPDRLLLETDAPYLAPVPHRRTRCDSSMIIHTAEKAASLKHIPTQELINICYENARRLFAV